MNSKAVRYGLILAAAATAFSRPALAQDNDDADDDVLSEIVVTARNREESLLKTPVTITALPATLLQDAQVEDSFALANLTPGLTFEDLGVRYQSKPIIRGLSTNSITPTQQKNSSFIDGIYVGGAVSTLPPIAYQQIEVLKGPQSAAFGRATFSGAINYVTHDPGNELSGSISAKVAEDDDQSISVRVGGPLIEDKLRGMVIGHYDTWDGNEEWVNSDGLKRGTRESNFFMGKLISTPTDNFDIELTAMRSEFNDGDAANKFLAAEQRNGVFAQGNFPVGEVDASNRGFNADYSTTPNPVSEVTKERISAQLNWDVANHTISLMAAYNEEEAFRHLAGTTDLPCRAVGRDLTGMLSSSCAATRAYFEDTQFDLRIASSDAQRFRYLLGVSYIDLVADTVFFQPLNGSIFFSSETSGGDYESSSVYGSISYDVTDRLTLGFEGRYNKDDLVVPTFGFCRALGLDGVPTGTCPEAFTGVPVGDPLLVREEEFTAFLPRVTLDYEISDDLLLYSLISKGNQPGSFNSRFLPEQLQTIEEEELLNYEAGFKLRSADGRLTTTVAAFYMEWSDQVFRRTVFFTLPGDPMPSTFAANVNAGDSEITGFEAEVDYRPIDGLDLRGTLAYTNAEFKEFCSSFLFELTGVATPPDPDCQSVAGNVLEAQPEWQGSLSAGYARQLGGTSYDWYVRGDYAFQSKKYASEMNLAHTPDSHILNARVGARNDRYTFELFVTNLTDDDAPTRLARLTDELLIAVAPGTGLQNVAVVPRRARQVGFRVNVDF